MANRKYDSEPLVCIAQL